MNYDETANPRHLVTVDERSRAEATSRLEELDQEMERVRKKVGVFNSKGWELIQADIVAAWQSGDAAIRGRGASSMQDIEFIRGQLAAFEFLLGLADSTKQLNEYLKSRYKELREQIEEDDRDT